MTRRLRWLDTGLMPARWNVAMTATLIAFHTRRRAPDTLRLHRYRTSVLLGAGQCAGAAADLDYCRRNGIEVARRVTGGGSVLMAPDMLAWELVIDRARLGGGLAGVAMQICTGIAHGLCRLGVEARFRAPNDIEVGGRKISGSSGHTDGHSLALQGTMLVDDHRATMAAALRLPMAEVMERVTCLRDFIAVAPSADGVAQAVMAGVCDALDCDIEHEMPTDAEIEKCEDVLHDEIGTDSFVFGHAGSADLKANS